MSNRPKLNVRVDEDVISDFRDFVHDTHGKIRGKMGNEVENALREYMDHDRYARIEENQAETNRKLDAVLSSLAESGEHTHTTPASPQTQTQKAEQIAAVIRENNNTVFPAEDVEDAIRQVAGASDRTIRDYKRLLKKAGHCYEHPSSDSNVWTTDREEFAMWADSHIEQVPDAHIMDIIEAYPIDFDEFERMVPA